MREIGYVVVEYNQASARPGIPDGVDVHWRRKDAEEEREALVEQVGMAGRRDRYEVAVVVPLSEWE